MNVIASNKLRSYVGFSIKARKIVYGYDAVVRNRNVCLVMADPTVNRTAKKELEYNCTQHNIPLQWCPADVLQACTAKAGCKCIGLTDFSLAKAANEEINRMLRGESNE